MRRAAPLFLILLAACQPEDIFRTNAKPDVQDVSELTGAEIYAENCASCHGADLSGEPGWPDWRQRKPDGRLAAPPHDESGHTWHHPDELLFRITKLGTAGAMGDPNHQSDMPAFGEVLSDAEIAAVLSYIKSTWKGRAREANAQINRQAAQK